MTETGSRLESLWDDTAQQDMSEPEKLLYRFETCLGRTSG